MISKQADDQTNFKSPMVSPFHALVFRIPTLVFLFVFALGHGQNCDCQKDFAELDRLLRKTPAYKDHKSFYDTSSERLRDALPTVDSDLECMVLLNRLTLGVKDLHIRVQTQEQAQIATEKLSLDLDSLKTVLKKRPLSDVEGIYRLPGYFDIGLFKSDRTYKGVVLASELENWEAGEVLCTMIGIDDNNYLSVFARPKTKVQIAYLERIKDGSFLQFGLKKDPSIKLYHRVAYRDSLYVRKQLNAKTTYIKVGSFRSFYPTLAEAEAFYATLKNTLSSENLVVDLRNNGGGGSRNSDILHDILWEYNQTGKRFILINNATGSNAEQFAVRLKKFRNALFLGDHSLGMIAYEKKRKVINLLPCGAFNAVMTSKRHKEYLPYEVKGVPPERFLDYTKDWIEQTLEIIEQEKP